MYPIQGEAMEDRSEDPSWAPSIALLIDDSTLTADVEDTVEQVRQRLQETATEQSDYLAVCKHGRIVGITSTSVLWQRGNDIKVAALPTQPVPAVSPGESAEVAAWLIAHAGAKAVAVEDPGSGFIGLVPGHRLLPTLVREHEIDIARLGGFLRGSGQARTASEEPVPRRVWHRAPWLLVGLLGSVLSAQIVRSFESDLQAQVSLAFFLPGIIYMADAVGTQTETLVIRGLTVGSSFRTVLRLEVVTGSIIGVLLSLALFPLAYLMTGDQGVALVVSLALMSATACATLIAMCLPWVLQKLNFDPAFGSGPLATVIQDLLSLILYFAFAVALL